MFRRYKFIVREGEEALLFHQGRLVKKLTPGKHVFWGSDYDVTTYDMRLQRLHLTNQELTCQDGVTVKASIRATFRYVDIEKAYRAAESVYALAYDVVHETMRTVISEQPVEQVLTHRTEISAAIHQLAAPRCVAYGLEIPECAISDLAVAGEIKRAYGQVLVAQKEAQAALERARGETAALRSLANAAKMIDDNPNLLQLRWIQAVDQAKGATIVLSPNGNGMTAAVTSE